MRRLESLCSRRKIREDRHERILGRRKLKKSLARVAAFMTNVIVFFHRPQYYLVMQKLQAFKFELQPTGEQDLEMRRFSRSCHFVYNKALALQKENHEAGHKFINYNALAKNLTSWLKEASCQPLQHSLKDLDKAFKNFFLKQSAFPCFKRKYGRSSFRYPDAQQIELNQSNNCLYLPKLDWVRYHNSRNIERKLHNVIVSCSSEKIVYLYSATTKDCIAAKNSNNSHRYRCWYYLFCYTER